MKKNSLSPVLMASIVVLIAGFMVGCNTSTVRLMVVRPALVNAQQHGGTVTVGPMVVTQPDMVAAVHDLRTMLQQRIINSFGRVVRLHEHGGGLTISGVMEAHGVTEEVGQRDSKCRTKVSKTVGELTTTEEVMRPCVMKRSVWNSRVAMVVRVTARSGQVLFLQRMVDTANGRTPEARNAAPRPNYDIIMRSARARLATRIARIVVPHRVQVSARLYDCPGRAEPICARAVAAFARSDYDGALMKYDRALATMGQNPKIRPVQRAQVHYNKALVFKYSRRFNEALTELANASRFDPNNGEYVRERERVERERDRHLRLIDQGLGAK